MKPKKHTKHGLEMIGALTEIAETLEAGIPLGKKFAVTIRDIDDIRDPGRHDAKGIKKLRIALGVSQAQFARMLGVSTVLVSSWEAGVRIPSGMARRLLDDIKSDPHGWMRSVLDTRKAG